MRRSVVLALNLPARDDPLRCIAVVGVTSDGGEYHPADTAKYPRDQFIAMPHDAEGESRTSFHLPCAANAEWVQRFRRDQLAPQVEGRLTDDEVDALIEAVRRWKP